MYTRISYFLDSNWIGANSDYNISVISTTETKTTSEITTKTKTTTTSEITTKTETTTTNDTIIIPPKQTTTITSTEISQLGSSTKSSSGFFLII